MIAAYFIFLKNFPFQFGIKQAENFSASRTIRYLIPVLCSLLTRDVFSSIMLAMKTQVISAIVRLCGFGVNEAEVKVQTVA